MKYYEQLLLVKRCRAVIRLNVWKWGSFKNNSDILLTKLTTLTKSQSFSCSFTIIHLSSACDVSFTIIASTQTEVEILERVLPELVPKQKRKYLAWLKVRFSPMLSNVHLLPLQLQIKINENMIEEKELYFRLHVRNLRLQIFNISKFDITITFLLPSFTLNILYWNIALLKEWVFY